MLCCAGGAACNQGTALLGATPGGHVGGAVLDDKAGRADLSGQSALIQRVDSRTTGRLSGDLQSSVSSFRSWHTCEKLAFWIKPTIKLPQRRREAHGVEKMKNACRVDGRKVCNLEIDVGKLAEPYLEAPALFGRHTLDQAVQSAGIGIDGHYMAAAREQCASGRSISAADVERGAVGGLGPDHKLQRERVQDGSRSVLVNGGNSLIAHGVSRRRRRLKCPCIATSGTIVSISSRFHSRPGGRRGRRYSAANAHGHVKVAAPRDSRYYRMIHL
jgi:hypothetical protein